jgi:Flp pilus assembly protein TadG
MAALIPRRRRAGRGDSGQALVEFAMVLPVFLLIFAGMADFAFLFKSYQTSVNAAREGARLAVLQGYDAGSYAAPKTRAAAYMTAGGLACSGCVLVDSVPVQIDAGPPVKTVQGVRVRVTYTYNFMFIGRVVGLINGTFRSTLPFTVSATMRNEVQPSS